MADDIKLVIKISEMEYKRLKWLNESDIGICSSIDKAIANGIPLTESDDYVSRKAVLDIFGDIHPLDYNAKAYISRIKLLPSVLPIVQTLDAGVYVGGEIRMKSNRSVSDSLTVSFDSAIDDDAALLVMRANGEKATILKIVIGEQADILYHLLTEQTAKAEIKVESEDN